jgi:hypothetical protein
MSALSFPPPSRPRGLPVAQQPAYSSGLVFFWDLDIEQLEDASTFLDEVGLTNGIGCVALTELAKLFHQNRSFGLRAGR